MPKQLGIRVRDYYDLTPALGNSAGDIWSGLPTFGMLGTSPVSGIVITPACDLSNRKVETITYLPIIPVRAYFATPAFIPEVLEKLEGQMREAKMAERMSLIDRPGRFFPPSFDVMQELDKELQEAITSSRSNEKIRCAVERARAGIRLLMNISNPEVIEVSIQDLKLLFGDKALGLILERIVGNSYRLDIHFLPADEQEEVAWSGVPQHSVVLFRHVFSAPTEIFERAQDLQLSNWQSEIQRLSKVIPGASVFFKEPPMKRVSLRSRFLADLLTRYVAMHVRLGKPDFTPQKVSDYVNQIGEF